MIANIALCSLYKPLAPRKMDEVGHVAHTSLLDDVLAMSFHRQWTNKQGLRDFEGAQAFRDFFL